jgi:hypothetical protein
MHEDRETGRWGRGTAGVTDKEFRDTEARDRPGIEARRKRGRS